MTAPVFVLYQIGLLFLDVRNGADWVTTLLLRVVEWNRIAYVAFVLAFGAALFVVAKRSMHQPHEGLRRIVVESVVLAVGLLGTVGLVGHVLTPNLLGAAPLVATVGGRPLSMFAATVLSAGAGFHEELVFRVVGFEGGTRLLEAARRPHALAIAALVSSFAFALAHHLGALGEPFRVVAFGMRFASGLYLCAVMRLRGFATAVYTHALYDVLVLVILR